MLVAPHDGPPYQELLYREIAALGVRVYYEDGPTTSQTLNIFLSPFVLARRRLSGCRVLHIHWVFQFSLPWAKRAYWARLAMEWWFNVYLWSARALGYSVIWTAHDLLPHESVFANDQRARRRLLKSASAVIALSDATASELGKLGARNVRVIPFATYATPYPVSLTRDEARASFGFTDGDLVIAMIGRLEPYKGADLLLRALQLLPATSRIKLLLAGTCSDQKYCDELSQLARESSSRVVVYFSWITDADLARYYQAADAAAFAFREITNSGSIFLAQSFGLPVVIPDLPNLRDIPEDSAIRVAADPTALAETLSRIEQEPQSYLERTGSAGFAWANRVSWSEAALMTIETYNVALATHV